VESTRRPGEWQAYRRLVCLFVVLGVNSLLLAAAFMPMFHWLQAYGSAWLAIGVLYTQIYLLSFWGAFRGGTLVMRLGAPILMVIFGGYLAVRLSARTLHLWPPEFAVLPVPLLMAYLVGLGLLLPVRWWSGKTLLFPGEEPPTGRPRQFRLGQIAAWILLMSVTLGLVRVATADDLPQVDLQIALLGPGMLGFVALLSIPLIRGVFAESHVAMWTVCGLLLVLGVGILAGGAEFTLLWQTYRWRRTSFDYSVTLAVMLSFHGAVALTLLGNFAAIRWLGGRFAGCHVVQHSRPRPA
jgi:hypothetical protein